MATRQQAPTGQAVATQPQVGEIKQKRDALKGELAGYIPSYQSLLPPGYSAEALVTGALVAATNDPKLLSCTPLSMALALARVAQWGLDVGTTAHLVPFGNIATPVADYKGFIQLMVEAGARKVEARVVRQGDDFDYRYGTDPFIRHIPKSTDAAVTHAYAIVWLPGGVTQFEIMSLAEIDKIRQEKSKSWKHGMVPTWYARKTVVRQLVKYVPKRNARLQSLTERDEMTPDQVDENLLRRLDPSQKQPSEHVPVKAGGYDGPKPPADKDGVVQLTSEEEEELVRQQELEILERERGL